MSSPITCTTYGFTAHLAHLLAAHPCVAGQVTLFYTATRKDEAQEAQVLEPHKCEGWEWVEWDAFPWPRFASTSLKCAPA